MIFELVHHIPHRVLVLLQKRSELLVFLEQPMVLDDDLRVLTLQFGLKDLCVDTNDRSDYWPYVATILLTF